MRKTDVGTQETVLNLSDDEVQDGDVVMEVDGVAYNADNATTDETQVQEGGYLFAINE